MIETGSKREFIENEFMVSSINAAFQRAVIYSRLIKVEECDREELRKELSAQIKAKAHAYSDKVDEDKHIDYIVEIAKTISDKFKSIIHDGEFRIGIAEKAFNLYLKYLWCMGRIPTPPHCPFDGIIIAKLKINDPNVETRWTELKLINDYEKLVVAARNQANDKMLAEWELQVWNENRDRNKSKPTAKA